MFFSNLQRAARPGPAAPDRSLQSRANPDRRVAKVRGQEPAGSLSRPGAQTQEHQHNENQATMERTGLQCQAAADKPSAKVRTSSGEQRPDRDATASIQRRPALKAPAQNSKPSAPAGGDLSDKPAAAAGRATAKAKPAKKVSAKPVVKKPAAKSAKPAAKPVAKSAAKAAKPAVKTSVKPGF